MPKYLLIIHATSGPSAVTICDSEEQRTDFTREAMFMDGDIRGHEDEFDECLDKLKSDGIVTFEGDPPIEWLTADVAVPPPSL